MQASTVVRVAQLYTHMQGCQIVPLDVAVNFKYRLTEGV